MLFALEIQLNVNYKFYPFLQRDLQKDMYKVRQCLSMDTSQITTHVSVISRPTNATLYYMVYKLQCKQNTVVRLITETSTYEHITHILKQLQWLLVDKWIIYKSILMTFKCLHRMSQREVYRYWLHICVVDTREITRSITG